MVPRGSRGPGGPPGETVASPGVYMLCTSCIPTHRQCVVCHHPSQPMEVATDSDLRAKSTQGLHDSNHRPSESMDGATDSDLPGEAAAVSAMCISLNSLASAAPGNLAKITFGLAYYLSHKPYRKLPRLTDANGARPLKTPSRTSFAHWLMANGFPEEIGCRFADEPVDGEIWTTNRSL